MVANQITEWVLLVSVVAVIVLTVLALIDAWRDLVAVVVLPANGSLLRMAWGAVRTEGIRLILLIAYLYIALELLDISIVSEEYKRSTLISSFTFTVILHALKILAARKDRHKVLRGEDNESSDNR